MHYTKIRELVYIMDKILMFALLIIEKYIDAVHIKLRHILLINSGLKYTRMDYRP